jgi:hypothetical protein
MSDLKGWGFKVCSCYSCFWIKYDDLGVTLISIYVDDCLVNSTDEGFDNFINNFRYYNFGLKVNHNLTDYLSCRIHVDFERKTTFLMQPQLINNLKIWRRS